MPAAGRGIGRLAGPPKCQAPLWMLTQTPFPKTWGLSNASPTPTPPPPSASLSMLPSLPCTATQLAWLLYSLRPGGPEEARPLLSHGKLEDALSCLAPSTRLLSVSSTFSAAEPAASSSCLTPVAPPPPGASGDGSSFAKSMLGDNPGAQRLGPRSIPQREPGHDLK